jgi:PAS domain S-box-containing protein
VEAGLDRYTQLFDFAPIGYASLSPAGKILELNHVGARLFGEPRAKAVGRSFWLCVASADQWKLKSIVDRVLAEDISQTCEVQLLSSTQGPFVARMTITCLKHVTPQALLAFENISAEKQAEETRRRQLALEEANRRKDEFLAVLSHELRTPLSVLLMHSQILQQEPDPERVERSAQVMERATREQTRLVDELLDLSRIAAGKLDVKLERVHLETTVRAVVDAISELAEKQRVALKLRVEPGVTTTLADPARIHQALSNLVGNALKFTPPGGEVSVTLSRLGGQARIEIRDTGVGIDREFLPHVFERFSQADQSSTRSRGGLGLGLAIAHSIVQAHGGQLEAKSEGPGRGSTFTLTLAVAKGAPIAAPAEQEHPAPTSLEGARLLVVEDDAGTRETVAEVLAGAGAVVRDAGGAREAMAVLDGFEPDALICDIAMPEEDGYSLLRRIRERDRVRGRKLPALALTAQASEQDRIRTRSAGFDAYVAKPVEIEQLLGAVSKLLGMSSPRPLNPSSSRS